MDRPVEPEEQREDGPGQGETPAGPEATPSEGPSSRGAPPAGEERLAIPPPAERFTAAAVARAGEQPSAGHIAGCFTGAVAPAGEQPATWPSGGTLPTPSGGTLPATPGRSPWLLWKVWGVLMGLCLVGSLVGVPYALAFLDEGMLPPGPLWHAIMYVTGVVVQFLPCLPAAALGLWLGEKVGLGAPLLRAWLSGERALWPRYGPSLGIGFLAGLAVGIPLSGLSAVSALLLPMEADGATVEAIYARLTPLKGLGGSLMAGVTEEVWFRLGLMTLVVYALNWLLGHKQTTAGVAWLANLLAVLPFGLLHLTNVGAIGAQINLATTALVVVLNGAAGVVFGWLYWRRGLEAAMLAHFSMDVVLHVLAPMVFTAI